MRYLQWDQSLEVGLEEIDQDHKHIIELANQLNDMVASRQSIETIQPAFASLRDFLKQYFAEEERQLVEYNCGNTDKHIAQHKALLDKFTESQLQLDRAESLMQVADIIEDTHKRIIDHMIDDDINLAQAVHFKKWQQKASWFERANYKIMNFLELFRIRFRLIMAAIFPLIAMTGFATVILSGSIRDVSAMRQVSHWIDSTLLIQNLVHELQKERGLSSGVISSDGQQFSDQLFLQRSLSNIQLRQLRVSSGSQPAVTYARIESAINHLREQVDATEFDALQSNSQFAAVIAQLLNIPSTSFTAHESHDISQLTTVLLTLMQYSEAVGMERAYGSAGFSQGYFDEILYKNLLYFAVKQQGLEKNINTYMPSNQLAKWQQLQANMPQKQIDERRSGAFNSLKQNREVKTNSVYWWDLMTTKIDMLYQFEQQLALQLKKMANDKQSLVLTTLIATFSTIAIVIVLTVLLSVLLGSSIVRPIERITNSLRELASGNRQIVLSGAVKHSEIGATMRAYEALRRSMIRMVILERDRTQNSFMMHQQMQVLDEQIKKGNELKQMTITDALTGVLNRRGFFAFCEETLRNLRGKNIPMSLLMLDIDFFKAVNDNYGHSTGDTVLHYFTSTCRRELRSQDIFGRLGGEEFAALLVGSKGDTTKAIVERICHRVSNSICRVDGSDIRITTSIGVTCFQIDDADIEAALKRADDALYKAKANGRNCAVLA